MEAERGGPASRQRARDLTRLCLLARRCGSAAEAEGACAEAVVIARILDDDALLVRAVLAKASFDRISPPARAEGLSLVDEALARLDGAEERDVPDWRAALLFRRAQYLAGAFQGASAARASAEVAALVAEGEPSAGARAWALAARLHAGAHAGGPRPARDQRAAAGLELYELSRGTEPELALFALEQRAIAVAESGDLAGAYAVMATYAGLAAEEGAPWALFRVQAHVCLRAAAEGRFDDAEKAAADLARLGGSLAPTWVVEGARAGALYVPRWLTGRAAELLPPFRDANARLEEPAVLAVLAFLAAETGAAEAGRALTRALAAWDAGADVNRSWGITMFNLVGAACRLVDREVCERLYGQLQPAADDTCVYDGLIYLGSFQLHLGRLALACGRWDAATAHLQTALDRHRRARATPWVALAAAGLADALESGDSRSTARSVALRVESAGHRRSARPADPLPRRAPPVPHRPGSLRLTRRHRACEWDAMTPASWRRLHVRAGHVHGSRCRRRSRGRKRGGVCTGVRGGLQCTRIPTTSTSRCARRPRDSIRRPTRGCSTPRPRAVRIVLDPASVLGLQRAVGNAGVGAMLEEERSPVHDVVGSGGGSAMEPGLRSEMEGRLGADFSDVRIHTDSAADASARSVQAHAYTVGSNVVFQRDQFDPSSTEGKTMLAHELTHVTQQRAGEVDGSPAPGGVRVSDPSDRFERAAVENAERAMSGPAPAPSVQSSAAGDGGAAVQREEMPEEEMVQGAFVQRDEALEEEMEG